MVNQMLISMVRNSCHLITKYLFTSLIRQTGCFGNIGKLSCTDCGRRLASKDGYTAEVKSRWDEWWKLESAIQVGVNK